MSGGESWADPRLSKTELQRRAKLTKLAEDVERIETYCALRQPQNLVVCVEGGLAPGAKLVLGHEIPVTHRHKKKDEEDSDSSDGEVNDPLHGM